MKMMASCIRDQNTTSLVVMQKDAMHQRFALVLKNNDVPVILTITRQVKRVKRVGEKNGRSKIKIGLVTILAIVKALWIENDDQKVAIENERKIIAEEETKVVVLMSTIKGIPLVNMIVKILMLQGVG